MRRWMVVAGLAVVLLAIALLRTGSRAPSGPGTPPAAPQPAPGGTAAPHGAPATGAPSAGGDEAAHDMSGHPGMVDETSRRVFAYPITMERLLAYAAAVKEIRAAGTRDAALMARLRERQPGDSQADIAARLDRIPELTAILKRHGLQGMDLVLMPQAVYSGMNAYALEQEGRPLPPDEHNVASAALYRADLPRMDAIVKGYMADLAVLHGRPAQ